MDNIWRLPIGDWGGDGHRACDWYIVKSNFTVEQTRGAYFKSIKESGFDISEEIAYEDRRVSDKLIKNFSDFVRELLIHDYIQEYEDEYYVDSSYDMALIVLYFIEKYNPEFKYKIEDIPMLHFYGYIKNRHIGSFGYGLF